MADIRCPTCGKDNPDFLDACQFCQTPLKPESMVHIGESPTKKNTGELEPILPQWLKDVRQQARDSAEEDAIQAAAQPKVEKNEPPDLLAGLASQGGSEEEEIPDWLASINPITKPKSPAPAPSESSSDFFAQFNKKEATPPAAPKVSEPAEEEMPSWMGELKQAQEPAGKDELSEWLSRASEEPGQPAAFQPGTSQEGTGWMSDLGSPEPASKESPAPAEKEDLSWLRDLEASAKQTQDATTSKDDKGWGVDIPSAPAQSASSQEDLSWLKNLGGVSSEPKPPSTAQPSAPKEDLSWLKDLGGISEPAQPASAQPSRQEDLSWLNELGGTPEPAQSAFPSPSTPQEDLSWLDTLGGVAEPAQPASTPSASAAGLDWLNQLGGISEPAQPEPAQPAAQDELDWLKKFAESSEPLQQESTGSQDLGWLDTLGGTTEPAQSTPVESVTSQSDLDWLGRLGTTSEPTQAESQQPASQPDDLSWLGTLGGTPEPSKPAFAKPFGSTDELSLPKSSEEEQGIPHVSPFVPRRTAPLSEDAAGDAMPDWLKSATEESPVLPLGASALDQIREPHKYTHKTPEEGTPPSQPEPASVESDIFSSPAESQALSNQEVDSLFSVEMPDWLSRPEPGAGDTASGQAEPSIARGDESLAPVELPSWVQAMRPVEAVLSETAEMDTQPVEKEGPLAGLRGVIPIAPIGSSRRPKAFSLKLQATDEHQASAALLEQVLASETGARAVTSSSAFTSQRMLRIGLAVLLWVVLGAVLFLRSQLIPVSAVLPADVDAASRAIASIPDNSSVLVVVDYEPSLAGEMEAVSGPLLNHLALLHAPRFWFLSTTPNGSALVERLMSKTRISDGLGYNAGQQYFNLGLLPGGSAGILGFLSQPDRVIPGAGVTSISEYGAVILLTDHAESGRVWVEQLDAAKQADQSLAAIPLILVTSAQAGPLLQPYVSSKQVAGMVNGLSDASSYEYKNNVPPGIARTYWDAFGIGILMAIVLITIGSLWGLIAGLQARRAKGEEG